MAKVFNEFKKENVEVVAEHPMWGVTHSVQAANGTLQFLEEPGRAPVARLVISHDQQPGMVVTEHVYEFSTLLENSIVCCPAPLINSFRINIYQQGAARGTPAAWTRLTFQNPTDSNLFDAALNFGVAVKALRPRSKMNRQEPRSSGQF